MCGHTPWEYSRTYPPKTRIPIDSQAVARLCEWRLASPKTAAEAAAKDSAFSATSPRQPKYENGHARNAYSGGAAEEAGDARRRARTTGSKKSAALVGGSVSVPGTVSRPCLRPTTVTR